MKHFYPNLQLVAFTIILLSIVPVLGQTTGVGIGTTNPRVKLEVAGDARVQNTVTISTINDLKDDDTSTFLIQDGNSKIKSLDVSNPTGAALGYIQIYELYDPQEDWVFDFDTRVDANEFVLNTLSASYDRELDINSNATIPFYSAFIKDGTWHITADFPAANNLNPNEKGTWTITTLIYSKDLSKQFGRIPVAMEEASTQSATNPIID